MPSLGAEITVDGPLGQRVLHTLTWSPRSVVLAPGSSPAVPSSWRYVSFAGLRFSVPLGHSQTRRGVTLPADWTVNQTSATPGLGAICRTPGVAFPTTTVTLSTDAHPSPIYYCPVTSPTPEQPENGVQVDSGLSTEPMVTLSFSNRCLSLHGLSVCPTTSPTNSILVLKVTVPGRSKPVYVSIGLAGNGMVARTILYSLRQASSSDACPGPEAAFFAPGELYGVQFLSVTTGWAVGSNEILATDDGGLRWTVQYRARCADLSEIDFVDAAHGWAVGPTDLLVTTDGGRHWQQLHEPAWPVRSVHFVTSRVGYTIAGGGTFASLTPMAPWTGGVVLKTDDAGQSWTLLDAPADAQSVCFSTPDDGWLGADGRVYRSLDSGNSWSLALKGYGLGEDRPLATVQCAGQRAGWAELEGPGGAMSQTPHVAYHSDGGAWTPIFAERYFPYRGVAVSVESPGAEPGAFSAIDADTAAFIDGCLACGFGAAPWAIAERGGKELLRRGNVGYITVPLGASFVTSRSGWVTGMYIRYGSGGTSSTVYRLVHTSDAGRTWKVEYTS